jgi:hypothetical protein
MLDPVEAQLHACNEAWRRPRRGPAEEVCHRFGDVDLLGAGWLMDRQRITAGGQRFLGDLWDLGLARAPQSRNTMELSAIKLSYLLRGTVPVLEIWAARMKIP